MPAHHGGQPSSLFGNGLVAAPPELGPTIFSLARIRLESVLRRTQNRPRLEVAQMCVNPRNANVSGLPSPRAARLRAACRPNSISRVFPGAVPG